MHKTDLQFQRFELKYLIPSHLAEPVRDFVRAYLELDPHGMGQSDNAYPIHSLYLDSDNFVLYWDTVNGAKNRFKLRLRFYEDHPDAPVFFEIKRRANEAILKQRATVRRDAVPQILSGQLPEPHHLLSTDPRQFSALQRFCELMLRVRAVPKTHVAYRREAWISRSDNSVRVTVDREIYSEPALAGNLTTRLTHPVLVFGPTQLVLEIKFTGRFPTWLGELVRVFGLQRCSAAKYADGVTQLGEHNLAPQLLSTRVPERRHLDALAVRPEPCPVSD